MSPLLLLDRVNQIDKAFGNRRLCATWLQARGNNFERVLPISRVIRNVPRFGCAICQGRHHRMLVGGQLLEALGNGCKDLTIHAANHSIADL